MLELLAPFRTEFRATRHVAPSETNEPARMK